MRDMTVIKEIFPEFEKEKQEAVRRAVEMNTREVARETTERNSLLSIRNLMSNMNWTPDKAMEALGIPQADRARYASQL